MSPTKTIHTNGCTMAFGRLSKQVGICARCDELRAGATPRAGYVKASFAIRQMDAIRAHSCNVSRCGPVCTFGDW